MRRLSLSHADLEMKDDVRLVKKHANRRLYDTVLKRYVSLEELRDLIVAGTDVRIEDAGSGEDLTRPILLQIMAECEQRGRPMLSPDMLMTLIRHYGHPMQDFVGPFLERSLAFYMRQEARLRQRMADMFDPLDLRKSGVSGLSSDTFAAMRDNLMQILKSSQRDS